MAMTFDATIKDLASVAQRMMERLQKEAPPEEAKKLLTQALLLTGLRVRRNVALNIFRGVRLPLTGGKS